MVQMLRLWVQVITTIQVQEMVVMAVLLLVMRMALEEAVALVVVSVTKLLSAVEQTITTDGFYHMLDEVAEMVLCDSHGERNLINTYEGY